MDLFATAGMDLPTSGKEGARARIGAPRSLRTPLFAHKVVVEARGKAAFAPTPEQVEAAAEYARKARKNFGKLKEEAVRPIFFSAILEKILGYKTADPDAVYSLAFERPIRHGRVDVALGRFDDAGGINEIAAPFEFKGPRTTDLDAPMPGRGRSPVQQAWEYAMDAPGARWVLVSNCLEIRLYGFGRGRDAYELFDLTRLDEPEEHARLWLILSAQQLLGGGTDALLRETDSAYKDVTQRLYVEYKDLRDRLIAFIVNSADGPKLPALAAIEPAQKILDRILFIAFAQRTDLLPSRVLERAAESRNEFNPEPVWKNFATLFRAVDEGNTRLNIWPYNGGLFAHDPVADSLTLPDALANEVVELGKWDYRREVPVTILGHIFEQSITDIERLKAEGRGEAPPPVGKRKREGVVYTPDMVTRFLVEKTIGSTLRERFDAGWAALGCAQSEANHLAFWRAHLAMLRGFTIVDPACGSGAFLVAAFDVLAAEYRSAAAALAALGEEIDFDIFDEIVTKNLFGVDLNAESVEITRLSLWLKTARRDHRLQNLESTIRAGDSLIEDKDYTARPFDWRTAFPQVFEKGGFDIVIGNPPYVRMEFIKPVKPWLEKHYVVAADRADLYAYFFERGVGLLKQGGRLGFISSSTFFRTGSGENLRKFLTDGVCVETVVDFGDLQIFEGVTTYPAILTLRKGLGLHPHPHAEELPKAASRSTRVSKAKVSSSFETPAAQAPQDEETASAAELSFLVVDDIPQELGRVFDEGARRMPLSRLTAGSWRFEEEPLAKLRDKIAGGRKTLGEVYGAPLYGIKTGFNEAFIIDAPTRDRLVKADRKSAELLKPFLRGEDVKRWRVEPQGLWLINTPKGKVDIETYPAIRDWLLPFKPELEKRATKQEWWELQQAQLAYQPKFETQKIIYGHFAQDRIFALDQSKVFSNDKTYFIPQADFVLLAVLNSAVLWFVIIGLAPAVRDQWRELRVQYVETLPIPAMPAPARKKLAALGEACTNAARERFEIQSAVRRRILDLAPPERRKLTGKLEDWHELDFAAFRAALKQAFRADIPLKERGEWEAYLAGNRARVLSLTGEIEAAEKEIDAIVYGLFDLTGEEIALLESSLAGQY
ncbi:MAG: type I restriction endonuclease subunit M [Methylocystis sp.]|nr:MAG: type I restriction endonuclease subunit M [Methylocystis sp.]